MDGSVVNNASAETSCRGSNKVETMVTVRALGTAPFVTARVFFSSFALMDVAGTQ